MKRRRYDPIMHFNLKYIPDDIALRVFGSLYRVVPQVVE